MSYQYQEDLLPEARSRYDFKLNLVGIDVCPFKLPADQWNNDPKKWPNLEYKDVYHYLIKSPRLYSAEAMENFRSLEAHTFFVSGWVQTVYHMKSSSGNFIFRADVKPSWRVTDEPHHPWVALKKNGPVITAHCDCMAGLGESCSHIGALLFKLEAAVRLGYTKSTCTDVPCAWNNCFVTNVTASPISEIKFYKEASKMKVRKSKKAAKIVPEPSTESEQNEFLSALASLDENVVGLVAFSRYSEKFVKLGPTPSLKKMPPTLRSLYKPDNQKLNENQLQTLCNEKFRDIISSVSYEQIIHLEEMTRNQSSSSTWFEQRLGRLTSSVAGEVLHTNKNNPAPSLIKRICEPIKRKLSVPSVLWGAEHEDDGFYLYLNLYSGNDSHQPSCVPTGQVYMTNPGPHINCSIVKSGFVLKHDRPYIGASPDGCVNCDCCGKGIIEIKCPFKYKDHSITDALNDGDFCLNKNFVLKETSKYYAQVQHQIYVCDVTYADFVVWTPMDCVVTRVNRNDLFINNMLETYEFIWIHTILPEILTRKRENVEIQPPQATASASDVRKYCKCGTTTDLHNMVGCDKCDDWFHPKCIGLKRLPKAKVWYCPGCRKIMKKAKC